MIERLKSKHAIAMLEFVNMTRDIYEDFFITKDKQRLFFKNNLKLVQYTITSQEVYGLIDKDLEAILVIYREKGFRPYLKLLAKDANSARGMIKFLNWNHNCELFVKIKKNNPLVDEFKKNRFYIEGLRGQELLLKKVREIKNGSNYTIQKS